MGGVKGQDASAVGAHVHPIPTVHVASGAAGRDRESELLTELLLAGAALAGRQLRLVLAFWLWMFCRAANRRAQQGGCGVGTTRDEPSVLRTRITVYEPK